MSVIYEPCAEILQKLNNLYRPQGCAKVDIGIGTISVPRCEFELNKPRPRGH